MIAILSGLLMIPSLSLAQDANNPVADPAPAENRMLQTLKNVGGGGGFETNPDEASTPIIIGTVVGAFLGFVGLIFIVLILIAGFKWMSANGNEEAIKKATGTIKNAIIGLIVALSAWSLWTFFLEKIILMG